MAPCGLCFVGVRALYAFKGFIICVSLRRVRGVMHVAAGLGVCTLLAHNLAFFAVVPFKVFN